MPPRNGIIAELEKAGLPLDKPHTVVDKHGLFVAKEVILSAIASTVAADEVQAIVESEEQIDDTAQAESTETLKEDEVVEKRPISKRKKS